MPQTNGDGGQESENVEEGLTEVTLEEFKASYEAIRNEILVRVRIRTQILGFFVAASGTLVGILMQFPTVEFMLIISFFSLSAALMVAHQDFCIALAANHCKTYIKDYFGKEALWNNCSPGKTEARVKRWLRFISQVAIISFPIIFSFMHLLKKSYGSCWEVMEQDSYVWWSLWIAIAGLFALFLTTLYREIQYPKTGD